MACRQDDEDDEEDMEKEEEEDDESVDGEANHWVQLFKGDMNFSQQKQTHVMKNSI